MSSTRPISSASTWALVLWCATATGAESLPAGNASSLEIRSLLVDGNPVSAGTGKKLRLAPGRKLAFVFGPATNLDRAPLRIRYKLDGYDEHWRQVPGEMRLSVRFRDRGGEPAGEKHFQVFGQSQGWTGHPETSAFHHRQESVTVPPHAARLWVVMSSAGPPNTVGAYLITNLVVAAVGASNKPPRVLVQFPGAVKPSLAPLGEDPNGWVRDGLHPSMAKFIRLVLTDGTAEALLIADDDPAGHAEWRTSTAPQLPAVSPGERLVVSWDEAYTIGLQGPATVNYPALPAGYYRFRINELGLTGLPTDTEASVDFEVPVSFWRMAWFWIAAVMTAITLSAGGWRYIIWRRLQHQLRVLEQQRAVERERVRIAQDIHDDLGTRVSQISMLTAAAQIDPALSDQARATFASVTQMSRDLVAAIYETVWAVNPENDTLDALADHICQVANQLCAQAQLRCRLEVPELPPALPLTSQVRHHLILALKEAIHNLIRYAHASEARIRLELMPSALSLSVHDDGCGFNPDANLPGNGLRNLKRRLETLGGGCTVESRPGAGTTVRLTVPIAENP